MDGRLPESIVGGMICVVVQQKSDNVCVSLRYCTMQRRIRIGVSWILVFDINVSAV